MANQNTKEKAKIASKALAAEKKRNPNYRQHNPPRKNKAKDFSKYANVQGFRK